MDDELRSFLIGTVGLDVVLVVAVVLTVVRRHGHAEPRQYVRLGNWFAAGIAAQFAHFSEEFINGFQIRFPELLGLQPWSARLFVNFNLAWIAAGLFAVPLVRRGFRPALFFAWFFAVASMANGVAHPLLALGAGGYVPGLWTSPVVGLLGAVLWRKLWLATQPPA